MYKKIDIVSTRFSNDRISDCKETKKKEKKKKIKSCSTAICNCFYLKFLQKISVLSVLKLHEYLKLYLLILTDIRIKPSLDTAC